MSLGDWLNQFFPANLAQGFGSSILILIGFWTIGGIVQQKLNYLKNKTEQEQLDSICKNSSINLEYESKRIITLQEAGLLGTALTITNLGTGISAGIAQLNILLTSGCSFLSSLLAISLGAFLGKTISSLFSRNKLEFIAGLSLTCLGIYEYFSP
jgi:putative sporulation protein YtaF